MKIHYLHCNRCGKQVSTGFYPISNTDIIVRAFIECPECIEKSNPFKEPKENEKS